MKMLKCFRERFCQRSLEKRIQSKRQKNKYEQVMLKANRLAEIFERYNINRIHL